MIFNDSDTLIAHNTYFSYIRQNHEFYGFKQVGKDILHYRESTTPFLARYGLDVFNHDVHPKIASAAIFSQMAAELVRNDYPMYCLSRTIIEEFLQTDLRDVSEIINTNFKSPLPLVFVAFPQKLLVDNAGDYITHAFIQIVDIDSERRGLKVACNLRRPGIPASSLRIATDYSFIITPQGLSYGRLVWVEDSKQALDRFAASPEGKLASIFCQIMLILSLGNEYLDQGFTVPTPAKKKKNGRNKKSPKVPRIIRFPQTKLARAGAAAALDSGQARRAHWKKGHWRNQAHGPKHSLRKVIWIRPTRVGSQTERPGDLKTLSVGTTSE